MNSKILSGLLAVMILAVVIELTRREKLTFKYASTWILLCLGGIGMVLCDGCVYALADLFGFELPSNFIFFVVLCGFVLLSLLLTIFLCQQNRRNDKIAQQIGIMDQEIKDLKNKG